VVIVIGGIGSIRGAVSSARCWSASSTERPRLPAGHLLRLPAAAPARERRRAAVASVLI